MEAIRHAIHYQPYNPITRESKQLYYCQFYRPGEGTYPLPDYVGALKYIERFDQLKNSPKVQEKDLRKWSLSNLIKLITSSEGAEVETEKQNQTPDVIYDEDGYVIWNGSKDTSQHRIGCAADIRVPGMTPDEVVKAVRAAGLGYDQVIREFDRWTHISIPNNPEDKPRQQALIIDRSGTRPYA